MNFTVHQATLQNAMEHAELNCVTICVLTYMIEIVAIVIISRHG